MALAPRVTHVDVIGAYRLAVGFADGSEQRIDFEPLLHGKWFGQLRDLALFKGVAIDPHGSLTWPNGVTVSPWTLHDWPSTGPAFVATVQKQARHMRRLRIFQACSSVAAALWLLWTVASWQGWIGGEPASLRDVTFPAAILGINASQLLVFDRSAKWGLVVVLASLALLVANIALR